MHVSYYLACSSKISRQFSGVAFAVPTKFQITSIEITVFGEILLVDMFQHQFGRNKMTSSLSLFRSFVPVLTLWRDLYPLSDLVLTEY